MENIKILVIIGPTAVGKTAIGVELARTLDGEIISGDSMQVYKHLDIGTAKVTNEEKRGIKHHLIDIIDIEDSFSVHDFQTHVRKCIQEIHSRGKLPIIVGGTGLYIKAALYDYQFDEIKHDTTFSEIYKDYNNEELYAHLVSIDEDSAKILHPNNRRRVLRAIEIYEKSGETKSEKLSKQEKKPIFDVYMVGLDCKREVLYERINRRVDAMMQEGLFEELSELQKRNVVSSWQSMQAIGYKEWFSYFSGASTIDEVVEKIKKNSRNYAKRQMTWFRNQFNVHWYSTDKFSISEITTQIINDLYVSDFLNRIVVAGGCFWGVEAYYQQLKGICGTRVGYAQGHIANPMYQDVKAQTTGHSEVVELVYNPSQISLCAILEHLFRIIDPTSLNKQGEDVGSSYRTGIYYTKETDRDIIYRFIEDKQKKYNNQIVVEVEMLKIFFDAEEYHQKYLDKNPNGYCHVDFNSIDEGERKINY